MQKNGNSYQRKEEEEVRAQGTGEYGHAQELDLGIDKE